MGTRTRAEALDALAMAHKASRCGARTRSGNACRQAAVSGRKRCRMHGGALGSGAPKGNQNSLKHGHYTAAAITLRRQVNRMLSEARNLLTE
ncbi:MAG: HGGxSTG domain-containing protein [Terricaulis sp.]